MRTSSVTLSPFGTLRGNSTGGPKPLQLEPGRVNTYERNHSVFPAPLQVRSPVFVTFTGTCTTWLTESGGSGPGSKMAQQSCVHPAAGVASSPTATRIDRAGLRMARDSSRFCYPRPFAMISFTRVSKQYGRQVLFVEASFQLNPGERVGLVGPNGAGKTTLFRMIVGEEGPDEGEVSVPKKLTIGYFRQDVEEMKGRSVLDEAIAGSGRLGDLHHELEALQQAMTDPARADDMDEILERFGEVQQEYDHKGGYALEAQAREVLHGLGFDDERIDGDVGALSGGWKMRVAMARVLLGRPDVLLMDEPTNHLDIESILWLEGFLKSYSGALFMTSHDREFMNRDRLDASPRSTTARSPPTRATTTSTSASGRCATRTARPPTRASRRCSPRSSASSSASRPTRPRRRRCRAA